MKLPDARLVSDLHDVGRIDSSAGDNQDAASGGNYESSEHCGSFQSSWCTSRCQDSRRAGLDNVFEGLAQIGGFIERAMKGGGQGPC